MYNLIKKKVNSCIEYVYILDGFSYVFFVTSIITLAKYVHLEKNLVFGVSSALIQLLVFVFLNFFIKDLNLLDSTKKRKLSNSEFAIIFGIYYLLLIFILTIFALNVAGKSYFADTILNFWNSNK